MYLDPAHETATSLLAFRHHVTPWGPGASDGLLARIALAFVQHQRQPDPAVAAALADAERLLDLGAIVTTEDAHAAAKWAAPGNLAGRRRPEDAELRGAVERVAAALGIPEAELYDDTEPAPTDVPCSFCGAGRFQACQVISGAGTGDVAPPHRARVRAFAELEQPTA